jgi:hypothetical protein
MSHSLNFSLLCQYDLSKVGITVPVLISAGGPVVNVEAKLDTGAVFCVFERLHGEQLGLDVESGSRQVIGTVTGSFTGYGHEVLLSAFGLEFTATVFFAESESFSRSVLGRQGWLDRLRVGIVDYDGLLYLSHYDEPLT